MGGYHAIGKMIYLLQLHDDFAEFSSIFLIYDSLHPMIDLNTKLNI